MIFIWTPNGGPLQYVGLGLFLLQIIPNLIYPNSNVNDAYMMEPPIMWLTFAAFHLLGFLCSQGMRESLADSFSALLHSPREFLPQIVLFFLTTAIFLGVCLYCIHVSMDLHFDTDTEHTPEEEEDEEDILFGSTFAIECVSFIVYFGIMCSFFVMMLLNWNRLMDDDYYATNDSSRDKKAMDEISEKVRCMPMEEFISEEDIREHGTVAQIQHMLQIRGKTHHHCLEKSELIQELEKCRKYDDTCCICATAYENGDPLKLWPKCCHQFHVECIDQWAYTFSTRNREDHTPTCPLCKEPLE